MDILRVNETLVDDRKQNPQSRAIVGDVARLNSGRVVARYRVVFEDGIEAYACRDYALDGGRAVLTGGDTPKDWGTWMRTEIERGQGRYRELGSREFQPADQLEYAAFREQFPHTARFIDLPEPATRSPLFDVGRVHFAWQWSGIDWRQLLHRHDSGDFGIYGAYAPTELTEEQVWTLAEQPVLLANVAAINRKSGPIRSRFRLATSIVVTVVTTLAPRGPRTLMSGHRGDADLAGYP